MSHPAPWNGAIPGKATHQKQTSGRIATKVALTSTSNHVTPHHTHGTRRAVVQQKGYDRCELPAEFHRVSHRTDSTPRIVRLAGPLEPILIHSNGNRQTNSSILT